MKYRRPQFAWDAFTRPLMSRWYRPLAVWRAVQEYVYDWRFWWPRRNRCCMCDGTGVEGHWNHFDETFLDCCSWCEKGRPYARRTPKGLRIYHPLVSPDPVVVQYDEDDTWSNLTETWDAHIHEGQVFIYLVNREGETQVRETPYKINIT